MSSQDPKPWYKKVSDLDKYNEVDAFLTGASGRAPGANQKGTSGILLALLAGYVGKAAGSRKWQ